MNPKTVRGASTGAPLRSRPRTAEGSLLSRVAAPARHACTVLVSLALASTPIHLGQVETSSDAAVMVASRPLPDTVPPRAYIRERASRSGWRGAQWRCLEAIIDAESHFNPKADNPTSSAYGVFQQLRLAPGATLADQTRLGLKYVAHRYGSPCAALRFRVANGWF